MYQHQNKKQNFVSSHIVILQIPFTDCVPILHIVSRKIISRIYPISCGSFTTTLSVIVCFLFCSKTDFLIIWNIVFSEDTVV